MLSNTSPARALLLLLLATAIGCSLMMTTMRAGAWQVNCQEQPAVERDDETSATSDVIAEEFEDAESSHDWHKEDYLADEPAKLLSADEMIARLRTDEQLQSDNGEQLIATYSDRFNSIASKVSSVVRQVASVIKRRMRTNNDYLELIHRFHKWLHAYKAAADKVEFETLAPKELVVKEYVKVDCEMVAEFNTKFEENEAIDFVYVALSRTIARLEKRLETQGPTKLTKSAGDSAAAATTTTGDSEGAEDVETPEQRQLVFKAFDRVKNMADRRARTLLANELLHVSSIVGLRMLYPLLDKAAEIPGDPLVFVRFFVKALGGGNSHLALAYLMNLQYRSAVQIISYLMPRPEKEFCDL